MPSDPSSPGWAGGFSGDHMMFVRDGRWHVHDAHTGDVLGILPLPDPEALEVANGGN